LERRRFDKACKVLDWLVTPGADGARDLASLRLVARLLVAGTSEPRNHRQRRD
jgi:hypothetical protein